MEKNIPLFCLTFIIYGCKKDSTTLSPPLNQWVFMNTIHRPAYTIFGINNSVGTNGNGSYEITSTDSSRNSLSIIFGNLSAPKQNATYTITQYSPDSLQCYISMYTVNSQGSVSTFFSADSSFNKVYLTILNGKVVVSFKNIAITTFNGNGDSTTNVSGAIVQTDSSYSFN
jgi:hypothetical protein